MDKTAYPISSTRHTERTGAHAFTLVEVMIGASLGAFILAGVLSTFLMIGRNGVNAANYCALESDARQGLETFSREARMASSVSGPGSSTTMSSTSVTFGIPDTSSGTGAAYFVTYAYDSTNQIFTRNGPPLTNAGGTVATTTLMHGVQSLSFKYYSYVSGDATADFNNTTTSATAVKQIELTLTAQRSNTTVANSTNNVLSARFILRNKS
jgi:Tfp pilus assembly protein PilW